MISRRDVALAGLEGDGPTVRGALDHPDPPVRAAALEALARLGELTPAALEGACRDESAVVRRRAAKLAARFPGIGLGALLADPDATVAEMAAWACGEHEHLDDATLDALAGLVAEHDDPLVREAAVAALGAIGDPRCLPAVLAATHDRAPIRRRAVIALVAFDGPEVEAAMTRALGDRDWQVREAAEELLRDA